MPKSTNTFNLAAILAVGMTGSAIMAQTPAAQGSAQHGWRTWPGATTVGMTGVLK